MPKGYKYTRRNVPEGYRTFPNGGVWVPSESTPSLVGANPPKDWDSWGKTTKATLFVGLHVGHEGTGWPIGHRIPDRMIYGTVYDIRIGQVGTKHGASFVQQKGHYIPPEATEPGPEEAIREPSMQVVIFPAASKDFTEPWDVFKRNIKELATAFLDEMGQKSVIIEFVKDGIIEDLGQYEWTP